MSTEVRVSASTESRGSDSRGIAQRSGERRGERLKISAEILDRQPPCNLDAERGVLGSILLLPQVCDDVALAVRPEDFYDDAHHKLYAHLLAMHDAGRRIDATLLVEHLRSCGDFDLVGGMPYLAEILQSVPNAAHAVHYAGIVRDKAVVRSLIHAGTEILRDAYEGTFEPRELLNHAEEKVFAILDSRQTSDLKDIAGILHEAMLRIDARMKNEHVAGGVETGFRDLDSLTGGLHGSELAILAARPSMGKTALAMNIAEHAALHLSIPTLFVSLEMSSIELADRLLCSLAEVNGKRLRNNTISTADIQKLVEKAAQLSRAPLFVDDSPSRTVVEIAATARRLKRKHNLGLVVIDYLQLIEADNPRDNRQEQVAKMTRRLKTLARELNVPVLCLSQLNRQTEVSKDNRPKLSHLRESGAIEQDADVVLFVHREEYYLTPHERDELREQKDNSVLGQAEIIVAKQRNGPTDTIKLHWFENFTRFRDATHRPYDEFEQFAATF